MKDHYRILVVYYSQTGQSKEILDCFLKPLRDHPQIKIDETPIEPVNQFPFPWPKLYFFSIFPECVYEKPVGIKDLTFNIDDDYDLVILASQVWFLSVSIPVISFLKHAKSKILKNKPIITVVTCRKMWMYTQKRLEEYIEKLGGKVVDRVLVTAQGDQMKTLTATKDNLFEDNSSSNKKKWRPSERVIQKTEQQGSELLNAIMSNAVQDGNIFSEPSDAFSETNFAHPEKVARRSFLAWGGWIMKFSKEKSLLRYLFTVMFLSTFFLKVFIGLPLWPIIQRFKKKHQSAPA